MLVLARKSLDLHSRLIEMFHVMIYQLLTKAFKACKVEIPLTISLTLILVRLLSHQLFTK